MTFRNIAPVRYQDGWRLWIYFTVDYPALGFGLSYARCQRFNQVAVPSQAQIDAAIATQQALVALEDNQLQVYECQNNLQSIYDSEKIGTPQVVTYNFVARSNFIVYLRQIYMVLASDWCAIIGHWFLLNVSDAEAKSIFSVTDAQLTALKTKFTNDYNKWAALKVLHGQ